MSRSESENERPGDSFFVRRPKLMVQPRDEEVPVAQSGNPLAESVSQGRPPSASTPASDTRHHKAANRRSAQKQQTKQLFSLNLPVHSETRRTNLGSSSSIMSSAGLDSPDQALEKTSSSTSVMEMYNSSSEEEDRNGFANIALESGQRKKGKGKGRLYDSKISDDLNNVGKATAKCTSPRRAMSASPVSSTQDNSDIELSPQAAGRKEALDKGRLRGNKSTAQVVVESVIHRKAKRKAAASIVEPVSGRKKSSTSKAFPKVPIPLQRTHSSSRLDIELDLSSPSNSSTSSRNSMSPGNDSQGGKEITTLGLTQLCNEHGGESVLREMAQAKGWEPGPDSPFLLLQRDKREQRHIRELEAAAQINRPNKMLTGNQRNSRKYQHQDDLQNLDVVGNVDNDVLEETLSPPLSPVDFWGAGPAKVILSVANGSKKRKHLIQRGGKQGESSAFPKVTGETRIDSITLDEALDGVESGDGEENDVEEARKELEELMESEDESQVVFQNDTQAKKKKVETTLERKARLKQEKLLELKIKRQKKYTSTKADQEKENVKVSPMDDGSRMPKMSAPLPRKRPSQGGCDREEEQDSLEIVETSSNGDSVSRTKVSLAGKRRRVGEFEDDQNQDKMAVLSKKVREPISEDAHTSLLHDLGFDQPSPTVMPSKSKNGRNNGEDQGAYSEEEVSEGAESDKYEEEEDYGHFGSLDDEEWEKLDGKDTTGAATMRQRDSTGSTLHGKATLVGTIIELDDEDDDGIDIDEAEFADDGDAEVIIRQASTQRRAPPPAGEYGSGWVNIAFNPGPPPEGSSPPRGSLYISTMPDWIKQGYERMYTAKEPKRRDGGQIEWHGKGSPPPQRMTASVAAVRGKMGGRWGRGRGRGRKTSARRGRERK